MVCALAEFTAKHFDARGSGFVLPLTVITVIQFSLAPLLPVFFAGALGMRKVAKTVGAFFSINVIVEAREDCCCRSNIEKTGKADCRRI